MNSIIVNGLDDLDENDLNFDGLDSSDDEASSGGAAANQKSSSVPNKEATNSRPNETDNKNKNQLTDDDDDILSQIPLDIPSTNRRSVTTTSAATSQSKVVSPLRRSNEPVGFNFENDEAEDDFIRTQTFLSSTQSATSTSDTSVFKIPVIFQIFK